MGEKVINLERSVSFLQEKHASTIEGLHDEISKLQRKCSEMIHQLAHFEITENDDGNDSRKLSDVDELKDQLLASNKENQKLKEMLALKEEKILKLKAQSKSKEHKYLNEFKQLHRKTVELQSELDHKAACIAYLNSKLNSNKVRDTILTNEAAVVTGNMKYSPSPPRGDSGRKPNDRKNTRFFTNPAANVNGIIVESKSQQDLPVDFVIQNSVAKTNSGKLSGRFKHSLSDPARPAHGFSQTRREQNAILFNRPKPTDYKDFIKLNNQTTETMNKTIIEPLPPIAPKSGKTRKNVGKTYSNKNTVSPTNSPGDVETVIFDSALSSPDKTYRKVQDLT